MAHLSPLPLCQLQLNHAPRQRGDGEVAFGQPRAGAEECGEPAAAAGMTSAVAVGSVRGPRPLGCPASASVRPRRPKARAWEMLLQKGSETGRPCLATDTVPMNKAGFKKNKQTCQINDKQHFGF